MTIEKMTLVGKIALILADTFLSLPSGYTAGDHEITIEEALDLFGKIVTDYPSYPHIGFYGGRRIEKQPIPVTPDGGR